MICVATLSSPRLAVHHNPSQTSTYVCISSTAADVSTFGERDMLG